MKRSEHEKAPPTAPETSPGQGPAATEARPRRRRVRRQSGVTTKLLLLAGGLLVACGGDAPVLPGASPEAPGFGPTTELDPDRDGPSLGLEPPGLITGELPIEPPDPWDPPEIVRVGDRAPAPDAPDAPESPGNETPAPETPAPARPRPGPPANGNPTSPPLLIASADVAWIERMDTPAQGSFEAEFVEGERRCVALQYAGSCAYLACAEAGTQGLDAGAAVAQLGAEAAEVEQPARGAYLATLPAEPNAPLYFSISGGEYLGPREFDLGVSGTHLELADAQIHSMSVAQALADDVPVQLGEGNVEVRWPAVKTEGGYLRLRLQPAGDRSRRVECRFDGAQGGGILPAEVFDALGAEDLEISMSAVRERLERFESETHAFEASVRNERLLFGGLDARRN